MPTIEIDGKKFEVESGKMVIEVADANGIQIPRFCYHKKLSVAANCRMCLVEVERAPKPMPACATPVMEGMKVYTRSPKAIAAQKNVMEFLLINHPLDCPICDQGGECELQDVSMGYGQDLSRYTEGKRSVEDEDIGSLISTEMTRCIHCTRCVRFGTEVAGLRELGATGRGEDMRIGTYIEESLTSEVSGNIIDLCPVGALTSKPFRFSARAWELQEKPAIAPHDCLGSHVNLHVRRQRIMRVVPRECEALNESWLSDRDRFAYTGLYQDRITTPMVKMEGVWKEVSWQDALTTAIDKIKHVLGARGRHEFGGLTSSYATTEEFYLFQKFLRSLGVSHLDHRVTQQDFRDDTARTLFPGATCAYEKFSSMKAIFLVGSDIHREQPLAGVRIRQARKSGAKLHAMNCFKLKSNFSYDSALTIHPAKFAANLLEILKAACEMRPEAHKLVDPKLLNGIEACEASKNIARDLCEASDAILISGAMIETHPDAADIRAILQLIASATGSAFAEMTIGPNQAGASLAGVLPHRGPGGLALAEHGNNAYQLMTEPKKGYLLMHLEPENDCLYSGKLLDNLYKAEAVVAITAYDSQKLREYADVILPAAAFGETSGTYVNLEGQWQSFHGVVKPLGEARPAWKILRVMGNLIELEGFEYISSQEILDELRAICDGVQYEPSTKWSPKFSMIDAQKIIRIGGYGIYATDPMQRRAQPLQEAASNDKLVITVSPNVAKKYNLRQGKGASAIQNKSEAHLIVVIDEGLPENCVHLPTGFDTTSGLGSLYAPIDLK